MGASDFESIGFGETIREAYESACDDARYEYGHSGYTGSIAETGGYVNCGKLADDYKWNDFVRDVFDYEWLNLDRSYGEPGQLDAVKARLAPYKPEQIIDCLADKWGPCIGVDLGDDKFGFCGMAST